MTYERGAPYAQHIRSDIPVAVTSSQGGSFSCGQRGKTGKSGRVKNMRKLVDRNKEEILGLCSVHRDRKNFEWDSLDSWRRVSARRKSRHPMVLEGGKEQMT